MRGAVVALVAGFCVAACGGTKPYRSDGAQNLAVKTEVDSGVRATLHVHAVGASCQAEYQGSVALSQPSLMVAIAPERVTYLDVTFDSSSLLAGSRSMNAGTLLRPRAGYRYEIAVSYRKSLYQVAIRETDAGGRTRELPRRELGACREKSAFGS
jgi:hypothetical protein